MIEKANMRAIDELKKKYPEACVWCEEFLFINGLKKCRLENKVVPNPCFSTWTRPNWCPVLIKQLKDNETEQSV